MNPFSESANPDRARDVYTVSRLNADARSLIEDNFSRIWVEGEISNLARPRSGHIYFSLKDDLCQVRCAMFRMHNRRLDFEPQDGMLVTAFARASIYQERGEFQLVVQHLEDAGAGALQRAFEALKRRLSAEGLFDPKHKQPLPTAPNRIGIVTSPTGAAIRDFISVLARRFPCAELIIYPVPVQGAGAGRAIAHMVSVADSRKECDVLVLARGGGSVEDLAQFNDESLARAIFACTLPTVSGVGHEIDFTIADFVADERAATPSAAAELVTPDASAWRRRFAQFEVSFTQSMRARVKGERQALSWLQRRLRHPQQRVNAARITQASLRERLLRLGRRLAPEHRARLQGLAARLRSRRPEQVLGQLRERENALQKRLHLALKRQLTRHRDRLSNARKSLAVVSPHQTLERGYAIIVRDSDGMLLRDAKDASAGDTIRATLAHGELRAEVTRTTPESDD